MGAKDKVKGITVVSPMWGDLKITNRMVFSVINQYTGTDEPLHIELVLVDDYIEGRGENDESPYEFYLTDEFKKLYDTDLIDITLIKNKEHKYQGESREIGFLAGKYDWFVLVDCDDMLAPNCCDRYRHIINQFNSDPHDADPENKGKSLACVCGLVYGFAEHGYEQMIIGESIWVQSRCFYRPFIKDNDIHFPTGLSSRQGEDYPFMRKLDYAIRHSKDFAYVKIPYNNNQDCQATAFWFPNTNSLSRKDPHYTSHLSGWTMLSSNSILEYFIEYNKKHGIEDEEDESLKHEVLNMATYAFYNLLDFLKEVAVTDYKPLEEDWVALKDSVKLLKAKLKDVYWDELVYSDIEDMLYWIKHNSDVHFIESWLGTFYDFMNKGFIIRINNKNKDILDMTFDEMMKYCSRLEFDGAMHEVHSKQVIAWKKRHSK